MVRNINSVRSGFRSYDICMIYIPKFYQNIKDQPCFRLQWQISDLSLTHICRKKFWYFLAKVFSFNVYKWKHWSIQLWKILTVGFSEAYNNRYYERHFSTLSTKKEFLWDIYLKWINFRADYISWFSRILAFSEKYISYKISQNFPSAKFNLREI